MPTLAFVPKTEPVQCRCGQWFQRTVGSDETLCFACDPPSDQTPTPVKKHLTDDEARAIYKAAWEGVPQARLATQYNVSQATVCQIKAGDLHRKALRNAPIIEMAEKCVQEYEGGIEGDYAEIAKTLFGAMLLGVHNPQRLWTELDVTYQLAQQVAENMTKNGLWTPDGKWGFEEDRPQGNMTHFMIEFTLHILVASGEVVYHHTEQAGQP